MRVRELLALILALVLAGPASAQDPPAANAGSMTVEDLRVTVSKSLVIDYPADISRISTSNPEVVDAVPATSREFLLHGKGHGSATVVVWAKTGLRTMYNVTVEHNLDPIKRLLKDTFPNENIGLVAGRDSITLIGTVSSKEVADRALAIATPLAKTVVSNLALTTAPISKQIILKVRFAELDRTVAQQFGVNFLSTGAGGNLGTVGTQQFGGARLDNDGKFTIGDALNVFAFRPDLNLGALVKALQAQGVLQILAEPNLVTTNGKEASFLVGGEFPVPVLQGGGNAGAVTIQFREFGIRLLFKPDITENNTIKLYVKPEVSTIDLANAVTFSGFTIPALATRRMETNIELGAGQSFVIAGLIDDRVTENFNKIPGLANIPILGTLFRSRSQNRSKSELVIIVTPEVVTPLNASDAKPEPAWLKEFLPQKTPGEKVGSDLVPGTGGGVVPPLAPGRTQISPNSFGHPDLSRPSAPVAPATAKPKSSTKSDADSVKRGKLKFWGHKPAADAGVAASGVPGSVAPGTFNVRPIGERPLVPSEAVPSDRSTTSNAAATALTPVPVSLIPAAPAKDNSVTGNAVTVDPVATPASAPLPAVEVPTAQAATPVEVATQPTGAQPTGAQPAAVETKAAEAVAAEPTPSRPEVAPASNPAEAQPPAAQVPAAGAAEVKPAEAKPMEAKPGTGLPAGPGLPAGTGLLPAGTPAAGPSVAATRRAMANGITSLPLQVLNAPPAATPSPNTGEQH